MPIERRGLPAAPHGAHGGKWIRRYFLPVTMLHSFITGS